MSSYMSQMMPGGAGSQDPRVRYVVERHGRMVSLRGPFNTDWMDIRNYVRPLSVAFNQITGQFQLVRSELMFDGTAMNALKVLCSALMSYIFNPAERWFELQIENDEELNKDPDTIEWLQAVSDIIYREYVREGSTFNLAMCYDDPQ